MSFKRDGNDGSLFKLLQNRRISELFAENIPEDEALLMKNGRFACLVCTHRPIFDTVLMLAKHRDGKKHAANAEQKAIEDAQLQALRRKRQHEEFRKTGRIPAHLLESDRKAGPENTKALLGCEPYSARHKNIRLECASTESVPSGERETATTSLASLPGSTTNDASAHRNSGKYSGQRQSEKRVNNPVNPVTGRKIYSTATSHKRKGHNGQTIADYSRLKAAQATEEHLTANYRPYKRKYPTKSSGPSPSDKKVVPLDQQVSGSLSSNESPPQQASSKPERPSTTSDFAKPTPQSGYIKDKFGKWVKDENAEFDSDDD